MISNIKALIITILCLILALIPEIAMYFIWGGLNPETLLEKLLVVGVLFYVGGGFFCILFAILAVGLWAFLIEQFC